MIELAPETLWLTRFCTQDEAAMYILFQKGYRLPKIKELDHVRYFLGVHHVIIWTQETVNNSDFESMFKARVIPVRDVC
jgi:hypothetical protein